MSAQEALNVVAFGVAASGDMTGASVLRDRWAVPLNDHDRHLQLLAVLRMLAVGECSREAWPEADMADPFSTAVPGTWSFQRLHETATAWVARHGLDPAAAAADLEGLLRYRAEQEQKLKVASGSIVRGLAEGLLTVSAAVKPSYGGGVPPGDYVPSVRFRTTGVRVWTSGEITFHDGSGYVSATFERAEVLRLWPLPPAVERMEVETEVRPKLSNAAARELIMEHARREMEKGTLPIASEVIAACMKAGASKRQAEAIWSANVPPEWKRPRGMRNQISQAKSPGD